MQANSESRTAVILPFPTARRATALNLSNKAKFAAEVATIPSGMVAVSDAWYHQAAIEEEKTGRKI
jgi:hypothetical protein